MLVFLSSLAYLLTANLKLGGRVFGNYLLNVQLVSSSSAEVAKCSRHEF